MWKLVHNVHIHMWTVSSDVYILTRFSSLLTPLLVIWEPASCPICQLNMWCLSCCRMKADCKGEEDNPAVTSLQKGPHAFLHWCHFCEEAHRLAFLSSFLNVSEPNSIILWIAIFLFVSPNLIPLTEIIYEIRSNSCAEDSTQDGYE